ncbi:hypothetical protein EJ03DRAFT_52615 [Teratosphaeria nubilosa]|uniref:RING-type domain-containing protein n=1 Tax=Teratosphaeria nubilosa TaxID=161662 RepID=A0A6G1KUA8_9PEZI|nr:hypothetical protein EJ03DRAFT_52615 [Teratosphaeria nubilosa]
MPGYHSGSDYCWLALLRGSVFAVCLPKRRLSARLITSSKFVAPLHVPELANEDSDAMKQQLEALLRRETFDKWSARVAIEAPGRVPTDPVCVICFDDIGKSDQICGLQCLHIVHRKCFARLVARAFERCPVCQVGLTGSGGESKPSSPSRWIRDQIEMLAQTRSLEFS